MLTPTPTSDTSFRGELLKVGEVARRLHVSEQTVRDWSETNKLNGILTDTGHRLFYETDVELCRLQQKGITKFWVADAIVVLQNNGEAKLFFDDYTKDYPNLTEVELTKWWNYSNGRERLVHALVSTHRPQIDVFREQNVYLWGNENDLGEYITAGIQFTVTAIAFEQDQAKQARDEAYEKATEWLRLNFLPKTVVGWFTTTGEQVRD